MHSTPGSIDDRSTLDPRMGALLKASGPINAIGALIFAPPDLVIAGVFAAWLRRTSA